MSLSSRGAQLPTADPYLPGHGDPAWSAEHYDLDLSYDPGRNQLRGQAVIRCVVSQDPELVGPDGLDRVVIDLAHLKATKVTLDGKAPATYATRLHRIVVMPRKPLPAGATFTLKIGYAGTPRPLVARHLGDAGWEELSDGVIVAGQPHGAPTWFPCNDRPDDKASYRIKIAVDSEYTVLANGTLLDRTRSSATTTWVYEQREPMASYLATVQIGRYEVRELAADPPLLAAVPADAEGFDDAFGRNPEMLSTFSELFGPYPFATYAVVVTDDELEIPLESQSLSTFGRNFLGGDWDCVRLVAHELAHQWFGNAVTLRRWRDIWLHEGFACYSEWLWSQASGGRSADDWARHHHARLAEAPQDLLLADPGPELMFDDRVYKRGALTLHALRLTVGDEAFFDVLRSWVANHAGGNVTTEDFVAHAADRTGAELAGLFTAWLDERPVPDLP